MNWEAIGAIGEIVGGIGVVVTLVYLALQIKYNTKATEKQSVHDAMEFVYSSSLPLIEDQQLSEIYLKGMSDFGALGEAEKIRFHYLCTTRLQAAQTSSTLLDDGGDFIGIREWIARMMRNKGFRVWWLERGQYVVDRNFRIFGEKLRVEIESENKDLSYSETYYRE
jgi:hypothetical protein